MRNKTKLFYAQPIDFVQRETIIGNYKQLSNLLDGLYLEILVPYLDSDANVDAFKLDREKASQIVEKDYAAIEECDIFLADLSREDRQAIGIIFEMAHAESKGKVIIVYTGHSSLSKRVWIVAISDHICGTWEEVVLAVKNTMILRKTIR